jgi:uncharacterized Zn finger protein (UPF0148 family)
LDEEGKMKSCKNCGKPLSMLVNFFTNDVYCKECKSTLSSKYKDVENQIKETKTISESQIDIIKKFTKYDAIELYKRIYAKYEDDNELSESELLVLKKIQESFDISNEDIKYDDLIQPYIYVNYIRKNSSLPSVNLAIEGNEQALLKKDEVVHFAENAVLKELRSVSLGYSGGSHGISFNIAKGVRYRIGAHRGYLVKEDRLLPTSQGTLILTNQRMLLHPLPGYKPVSIPLDKILSYHCFNNGIEVYKEGREKGFFFHIGKSGPVEVFGLCLNQLLGK